MGKKRFHTPAAVGLLGIGLLVALGAWHLGRPPESEQLSATIKSSAPEDGAAAVAGKQAGAKKNTR